MPSAIVTGASRGIGRAIAICLGEQGYTVFVTGRSRTEGPIPGTIDKTAQEVTAAGGTGVAVACDHADDEQVAALFERVAAAGNGLDVLVNNLFPTTDVADYENVPFYEQPLANIDGIVATGLRTHFVSSWHAVPLMRERGRGLIVNISSAAAIYTVVSPVYCVAKAGLDKFTVDASRDLKGLGIAMVSLWPGPLVGTEMVQQRPMPAFSSTITESPFVTGRAVAVLASDPNIMRRSGRVLVATDVLAATGLTDIDGTLPPYPFDDAQMQQQLLKRLPTRLG
ncbi:MAG: SDR family NAD(P)-dependent oxidoreductase [Acidimicrobiia bacterium]